MTTLVFEVTEADTAAELGSGTLPVLATPRLLAWCEAATCASLEESLPAGSTSVGTRVQLEHLAASAVGQRLEVTATEVYADGRLHRFSVAARHLRPMAGREGQHGDGQDGDEQRSDGAGDAGDGQRSGGQVVATGEITRVVVDADRFLSRVLPPPA